MKPVIALLLLACAVLAGDSRYHAQFVGGTFQGIAPKSSARLTLTDPTSLIFECRGQSLTIGYTRIDSLEYGQNVSRRYAAAVLISPLFLLSKARRHFVTIGYMDDACHRQALVFRVEKGDIRGVLTTLEARSGRRVEFQDEEARKTGK